MKRHFQPVRMHADYVKKHAEGELQPLAEQAGELLDLVERLKTQYETAF